MFVLQISAVLGSGQKRPAIFPAGEEDSPNSPGEEKSLCEAPDTSHLSQACEQSPVCTAAPHLPYPHLATSKKGQSELGRQLGSLRRMTESLRLENTPRISEFNL